MVDTLTLPLIHKDDLNSVYPKPIVQKPSSNAQKSRVSITYTFDQLHEQVDELIISMRFYPEAIKSFRNMIRAFDSTGVHLPEIDKYLRELGIQVGLI